MVGLCTRLCSGVVLFGAGAHQGGAQGWVSAGFLVLCWVLALWVVMPDMLLRVSSCLVAVACAPPAMVPACGIYSALLGASGFVVSAVAVGVGCADGCWRGFASCGVLRVPICNSVLLRVVCIVCSYCCSLPVVYGRCFVLMLLVLYARCSILLLASM